MTDSTVEVPTITLRVPGKWSHPQELLERLAEGIRLSREALILPDRIEIEFVPIAPDDRSPEARFAFTAIVQGRDRDFTTGMQTMGLPDLPMRPFVDDEKGEALVEIILYACSSGRPFDLGHIIADEEGPRFQIVRVTEDEFAPQSPTHNPYGCLKLVNMKELAEGN